MLESFISTSIECIFKASKSESVEKSRGSMRHDPFDGLDQTGINGVADGLDRGGILGLSQDKMSLVREKKEEIEKVLI